MTTGCAPRPWSAVATASLERLRLKQRKKSTGRPGDETHGGTPLAFAFGACPEQRIEKQQAKRGQFVKEFLWAVFHVRNLAVFPSKIVWNFLVGFPNSKKFPNYFPRAKKNLRWFNVKKITFTIQKRLCNVCICVKEGPVWGMDVPHIEGVRQPPDVHGSKWPDDGKTLESHRRAGGPEEAEEEP